ncbi:MAG TPA: TrmJ/YjtD family RNA methyltransferase [Thermoanaerobaculia bacterium]|nr:TrmJ/YjtD family RNA methyltransferase [Thermoanaerobaculia bacterium]
MHVRIILVEPLEAGNVGATARAMKNFGFTDLWIVGGKQERVDDVSAWWAVGALEIVQAATRVDKLEDALADCHLTVATTAAARGRQVFDHLEPADVARLANEQLGDEHRIAVVFGREKSGLTGREVMLCQRTASIPTWPEYPTMNLAVSVALFCYELGRGLRPAHTQRDPAAHQLIHELTRKTRELLGDIGYFGDKSPDRMCAELQAMVGRAALTTREASLLLAMVRKISADSRRTRAEDPTEASETRSS